MIVLIGFRSLGAIGLQSCARQWMVGVGCGRLLDKGFVARNVVERS